MYTSNIDHTEFELTVRTSDDGAEIVITDSQFLPVVRKVGDEKKFKLQGGIYGIRVSIGSSFEEKTIHLSKNETVDFDILHFASAAPLEMTSRTDVLQSGASQSNSTSYHLHLGTGSAIYIFSRDWTTDHEKSYRYMQEDNHPARGLTLRDDMDTVLANLADSAFPHFLSGDESWSACNIEVNPGFYRLVLDIGDGETLEMNIVASQGWQTQVFLLQRDYGKKRGGRKADLANASIFLSRVGTGFDTSREQIFPDTPNFRMAEIARQGLTNERSVLSDKTIGYMLTEKFSSPMLGIYGANLLLISDPNETSTVATVVRNLRRILGNSHPDVEALALRVGIDSSFIFTELPMLRKSWAYVLQASTNNPGLVPQDSFACKASQQLWSEGPWLIWGKTTNPSNGLAQTFFLVTNYLQNNESFEIAADFTTNPDITSGTEVFNNIKNYNYQIKVDSNLNAAFNDIINNIDPKKQLNLRNIQDLTGKDMKQLVQLTQAPQSVINSMLDVINTNYENQVKKKRNDNLAITSTELKKPETPNTNVMEPINKEQIQKKIQRILQSDTALAESFEKNKDELFKKYADEQPKVELPPELVEAGVSADIPGIPDDVLVQESIVMAHLRPVMMIRDNQLLPKFDGPDVVVWKDRLMSKKVLIDSIIPSVGRVEVKRNAVYKWVGTGWLVDTDIIVTNRHVASIFAQNREGFSFKVGYPDGHQSANMDFLEEYQRNASNEFDIESVLWIAPNEDDEPDIAFMKVKNGTNGLKLPAPILLGDTAGVGETVITIGYPARDPRIPDQELVLRVFGNVYDKKRLAPGEVTVVDEKELQHDCSTLGGNSGSVVFSLNSGKAVGLHFAGLYMQANYAVSAKVVSDLLKKVKTGTLSRMNGSESSAAKSSINSQAMSTPNNKFTFEVNIPIKITVEVGGLVSNALMVAANNPGKSPIDSSGTGVTEKNLFEQSLALVKQKYEGQKGIISVEEGYRFRRGWITDEKVIVVEVTDKFGIAEMAIPEKEGGVGVEVRTGSVADQLESIGVELPVLEAVPAAGLYREPSDVSLKRFTNEQMEITFHVSPDSGWPNLKAFIGRVKQKLTATIYEWEAEHISDAIFNVIQKPNGQLKMVTQFSGTREAVEEMKGKLGRKFQHIWASVGGGGMIVPTAYHIKVASRDDEEFWLSSGNWKNSNQADIDPAGEGSTAITPLRTKNREWHAIVQHAELAQIFRKFIDWDFKEATRLPFLEAPIPAIYLFVPDRVQEAVEERRGMGRYFKPLTINRVIDIEPLLTPDRNDRGQHLFIKAATEMIKRATKTIDIENQSFSLLDDNDEEYERFYNAVLKKQEDGLDIRIIFRDPREFSAVKGQQTLEKQLTRLKQFGLDTDNMKVQVGCHTKAIIIDSNIDGKGEVMFGSHNLTTSGALFNRDASLLVRDTEIAQYFQQIFNFDWEVLASQTIEESVDVTVAQPGVEIPRGYKKVSLEEYMRMYEE